MNRFSEHAKQHTFGSEKPVFCILIGSFLMIQERHVIKRVEVADAASGDAHGNEVADLTVRFKARNIECRADLRVRHMRKDHLAPKRERVKAASLCRACFMMLSF